MFLCCEVREVKGSRMWPLALTLDLLLWVSLCLGACGEQMSYRPQSCTLKCIQQGDPECEYCRITADDVQLSPSIPFTSPFGSCVPWPCHSFLGQETPEVCLHFVDAPRNIHIEFEANQDPTYDAITVSWNPSQYACPEKNGLEGCKKDWYPRYVEVHQENQDILVTFNLAPENFKIHHYFSSCFGGGLRNYTNIEPDFSLNKTHHTFRLQNLRAGTNYTCEIAADVVDAVRKTFSVVVQHNYKKPPMPNSELIGLLCLGIMLAAITMLIFTVVYKKRLKKAVKTKTRPDIIEQYYDKKLDEGQCVLLDSNARPPRLLICYSSNDGPAHVRVVLQLAAFLQKHMATQVHLDLWEALSIMEDGILGWHCRRMKECDFVLVICSRGLLQNQCEDEDQEPLENTTLTTIAMIGQEMCHAKALGQDLSKYMAAIFEYSEEADIPAVLGLASRYTLTKDLPLLFSHLHGVSLQKPGVYLQVENISESGYSKLPAGAALQRAIQEAKALISDATKEM